MNLLQINMNLPRNWKKICIWQYFVISKVNTLLDTIDLVHIIVKLVLI